jgi:hypothetical protein
VAIRRGSGALEGEREHSSNLLLHTPPTTSSPFLLSSSASSSPSLSPYSSPNQSPRHHRRSVSVGGSPFLNREVSLGRTNALLSYAASNLPSSSSTRRSPGVVFQTDSNSTRQSLSKLSSSCSSPSYSHRTRPTHRRFKSHHRHILESQEHLFCQPPTNFRPISQFHHQHHTTTSNPSEEEDYVLERAHSAASRSTTFITTHTEEEEQGFGNHHQIYQEEEIFPRSTIISGPGASASPTSSESEPEDLWFGEAESKNDNSNKSKFGFSVDFNLDFSFGEKTSSTDRKGKEKERNKGRREVEGAINQTNREEEAQGFCGKYFRNNYFQLNCNNTNNNNNNNNNNNDNFLEYESVEVILVTENKEKEARTNSNNNNNSNNNTNNNNNSKKKKRRKKRTISTLDRFIFRLRRLGERMERCGSMLRWSIPMACLGRLVRRYNGNNRRVLKWVMRINLILTFLTFILSYASLWYTVIMPFKMYSGVMGVVVVGVGHLLALLLLVSWGMAVFADPGYVPLGWSPFVNTNSEAIPAGPGEEVGMGGKKQEVEEEMEVVKEGRISLEEFARSSEEETSPNGRSMCHLCGCYKPQRCHHCSDCNRCVLKMDHHCPYINNCVGQRNLKVFILFLFYGASISLFALFFFSLRAVDLYRNRDTYQTRALWIHGGVVALNLWGLLLLALASLGMCIRHSYYLLHNQTVLEAITRGTREFDMGYFANLKEALGSHVVLWLIPSLPPKVDDYARIIDEEELH